MVLNQIIKGSDRSLDEMIDRQINLGGIDLNKQNCLKPYKQKIYTERYNQLERFYNLFNSYEN